MQVLAERCAGRDVHKRSVVVTARLSGPEGRAEQQTRTFGTMTADREELATWLDELQIKHVAMESTGVYWWPVFNLLADGHQVVLANPRHIKAVPGRKTAVQDSAWLADAARATDG
jgi:transposase